jgi:hypothetical protein
VSSGRNGWQDVEDVRALVHAYAELLDEGELDGVAHLFTRSDASTTT